MPAEDRTIFTFINKLDRPSRPPLELLDEIEEVLGMEPVPVSWPSGDGPSFKGVYDRNRKGVFLYERIERNERMAPELSSAWIHCWKLG
jgi:peptide chain release factor 3